jgi:hypothetical protein
MFSLTSYWGGDPPRIAEDILHASYALPSARDIIEDLHSSGLKGFVRITPAPISSMESKDF